ncbi:MULTISPECIES: hypothetical protein [unclassified Nocardioides]|uniref:hypothetical protein n=1 Tax=unclassified Nocardioides TaxID=2615069 RepID=UPI0009F0A32F|nr:MULTISPECIES: hypothetical protein [unclassified Nocardioides]GAW50591.1 hypothetical protein PD653B2_2927 [Nocardioides sp. PD653-B2]GAW57477.1 hypothetical protein PD653_4922 [Nocardioides sp. PD653]
MAENADSELKPLTYSAIEAVLPDGWQIEAEDEGGQPNGSGEIEESNYREWFSPERETHHRTVITLTGPWLDGPTEHAMRAQESADRERARTADAERAEYERLRAKYEPQTTAFGCGCDCHRPGIGMTMSHVAPCCSPAGGAS